MGPSCLWGVAAAQLATIASYVARCAEQEAIAFNVCRKTPAGQRSIAARDERGGRKPAPRCAAVLWSALTGVEASDTLFGLRRGHFSS